MSDLRSRRADEPVLAYKAAGLDLRDGRPVFTPVTMTDKTYGVEAVAVCALGGGHRVPDANCHCGFYGVALDRSSSYGGPVRLEVEFSGRVIVHETGWRAERQRVLRAVLLTPVVACPEHGVPATGVRHRGERRGVLGPYAGLEFTCPRCLPAPDDECETVWSRAEVRTLGERYSDRLPTSSVEDWLRSELPTDWRFAYQHELHPDERRPG